MRTIKLKKCKRVSQLRFSPDGRRLVVVGAPQAFIVEVAVTIDVASGEELDRVEKLGTCGVVTPDCDWYFVGGSHDYDAGPPFQGVPLWGENAWQPIAVARPFPDVFGLATDHTGAILALGYGRGRWAFTVDVVRASKDPVARLSVQGPPTVLAFNHSGTRLAVTGGPEGEPRVDVFELPSGKQLLAFAPPGTRTTALLFHPDGRLVVANSRSVYVRPPDSAAPQFTLGGHKGQINALALSPDGKRLLSASHDGAIRVWNSADGSEVRSFDWQVGPVTAVAFAPDGMTCAAAGKSGQLVLWDVDG